MTKLVILEYPDPRLRKKAAPVTVVDDALRRLVAEMLELMYASNGVGLAATQVNVHQRLLVLDVSDARNEPRVLINPEILSASGRAPVEEGCLSVPGIYDKVSRATKIRFRALDRDGQPYEMDAEGLLAVCVQHEMDHLDGRLFVDHLSELKRQLIRRRMEKERRQRPAADHRASAPGSLNRAPRSLALAFAGTPEFALPALDALAASRHRLVAVFTQPDRPAGRGRGLHESAVKRRARELGLAVHQPTGFKSPEALRLLESLGVDAWVVVAYGSILPPAALAVPALGCFNIHASLLPRWRGAAPIQRAILAGDTVTGVSIMRMEAGLDTGPVLASRRIDIHPTESAAGLHDRLALLGGRLIVDSLDALAAGTSVEMPQAEGATYAAKIDKTEALIDWRDDAGALVRKIRAFNPWPVAETCLDGVQLRLWEAEVATADVEAGAAGAGQVRRAGPEGIEVACGRGTLRVTRLQLAGRKALAAAEFLKAQPLTGARLGAA